MKVVNGSFEGVAEFKYLGTTLTYENCMNEEIKSKINLGNACYHSVQSLLSSCPLSRNVKVKIYKIIILPVVLSGCEAWSLRKGCLRMFENRVLRRMLHSEDLHNLYSFPDIVRQMKLRIMRWVGHVARIGEGRRLQGFGGKAQRKRPLGRLWHIWEDGIGKDHREIGLGEGECNVFSWFKIGALVGFLLTR
jgi:hypothetical protein